MARIIRLLIISVSLLILPTRVTPPATTPYPVAQSLVLVGRRTVQIRKYLVLQRIGDGRETSTRIRLYDITIFVAVDQDQGVLFHQRPPGGSIEEFSTRIRRVRPANDQEGVYGKPECCPVLPVF